MKKLLLCVVLAISTCGYGQTVYGQTPNNDLFVVSTTNMSQITIHNQGPKLIEIRDEKGDVTLTVMSDGSVVGKDLSKIDDSAKLFWQLMAKYLPEFCRSNVPNVDGKEPK